MLVFASWHVRRSKINTGRERAQLFVGIWVQHGVSQLNVTRIVAPTSLLKPNGRLLTGNTQISSSESAVFLMYDILNMPIAFLYSVACSHSC